MIRRLLPLLVAFCTLVPADVLARWVESCREADRCCCRHDDARAPAGPVVERADCCDAPCDGAATAMPAIRASVSQLAIPSDVGLELAAAIADRLELARVPPRAMTRGPPTRVHAFVQHWLV